MYVIVFLLSVLICLCVSWRLKRKCYPKPPLYPGALPVIGHSLKLLGGSESMCRLMFSVAHETNINGGVLLWKLGWNDYYVITDPDDFVTAANQCLRKHYGYQFLDPWLGSGMITGKDLVVWRRHRKLLNPAFGQQVIDGFLHIFNKTSKHLVDDLKREVGKGPFDHAAYLDAMALQSICQTSFGMAADFNTSSYMRAAQKMLHISAERLLSVWKHSDILFGWSALKREQDTVVASLNSMSDEVLRAKRQKISSDENMNGIYTSNFFRFLHSGIGSQLDPRFKAFMDLALELSDKGSFTEKEVWEEMNTIILAGYETTGNCLMYTILLLGSHVNVQNKVYEELKEVFGDTDRDVEKQDLPKLTYLEAVLKESLRIYAITPAMLRAVDHDVQLKNYVIPAGSTCLLFNCGMHRHSVWGRDADQFNPERWLDPVALADPNAAIHRAFTGFGVGKRLCLGKSYAMMSMKTTLAHVLRHYRVASDVTNLRLRVDPLLKPVSGHHVAIELRN